MGDRCHEVIAGIPQFGTDSIHGIRYILRRVARQVFPDRIAEQLAPGFLGAPRQPLGAFNDIVRNGNHRPHNILYPLRRFPSVMADQVASTAHTL